MRLVREKRREHCETRHAQVSHAGLASMAFCADASFDGRGRGSDLIAKHGTL